MSTANEGPVSIANMESRSELSSKMDVETQSTTTTSVTDNNNPSAQSEAMFKVDQKVYAVHGPLRYLAKILDIDPEKGYFIHYEGWNKKWDEWVSVDRLFVDNEENRKEAERIKREMLDKSSKRQSTGATSSNKRKRGEVANPNDDPEDDKDEADKLDDPPPVRLNLPDELKNHVIRDWENLTQKNKICNLPKPADKSVSKILDDFKSSKKKMAVYAQICDGLAVYFDRALPTILLYRVERPQFEKLRADNPGKRPCDLYGGEHLLRLFVRLPQLLANTELDDNETKQLCARLQDVIKFLSKESSKYFSGDNDGAYIPNTSADGSMAASGAATA